jgi:D-sedoheptulose 7-phosphate isomerase
MGSSSEAYIQVQVAEHREVLERLAARVAPMIVASAELMARCLSSGGKILICGNGGSAADAQHIAAELVCRFACMRRALPAIALTTDGSVLTAIANDLGYERVFERQVEALARAGDVVLAISTSGTSPNVLRAVKRASELGCHVVGWVGDCGGMLASLCDIALVVPSAEVPRIQEMHGLVAHLTCGLVERVFGSPAAESTSVSGS